MAIRNLLFTSTRRGCSLPSTSAVLSSSRFLLMEKLQCTAFQNCPGASLPWFTGSAINKYESIKFRQIGISSLNTNSHPKVVRLNATREFNRLRVFDDSIQLPLGSGILSVVRPLNLFNGSTRGAGIGWRGDLPRRCFSQASKEVIGNKPPAKPFWKHRKHPKLLVALSKKSDATAVEETDTVTLEDQLIEGNKVVDITRKAKEKDSKRPRNTKSKKQDVDTVSSPDVASKSGTKEASHGKKSKNTKGASMTVLEQKATESTPVEASNDVAPKKSKKPSKESKGKLASVKEGKVLKKTEVASSTRRLPKISTLGNESGRKPERKKAKQLYPPIGKSVMVVESATKAKVIQGYLGDLFEVVPSYGHVRDLAARSGSVRPNEDFSMVWEVPSPAWTHLKSIKVALNGAENLILASDPDREGEAIAWHIVEMLEQQGALHENLSVSRVVFHEITESSIKAALQTPREIDANLVQAYLARRALDYLIGFNISPLLWRKLPGCQSAGRVQSAALSLLCDREMEIDEFKPQEYWTVDAAFLKGKSSSSTSNLSFMSHLTQFDSKKLSQLSIGSHEEAKVIEQLINSSDFKIVNTKKNQLRKNPPAPYITSTLQQDAANRLHFSAAYTMKLAQKLYEGIQLADGQAAGLITYIRTDGLHISDEAVADIRSLVTERYGQGFASDGARRYFKKLKNAQEAHEAIRPTNIRRLPSNLAGTLDEDSLKLYTLIWSRSMSCQMEPAIVEQIHVDIGSAEGSTTFRSSCSRVGFPGYQAVYQDLEADAIKKKEIEKDEHDEVFNILSSLKTGDPLYLGEVNLKQHHTQPPSRYSEGSLVKKLEELGIGRPSTYASTLKVLQERKYVTVESRVLHPEFRGRMVSAFLSHHFSEVTDYCFTADMETELDNVSAGLTEWKGLLKDYWTRFSSYCSRASNVHIHQVEKMLEKTFGDFLFASLPDKNRTCPSCLEGTLIFKVSRYGEGYFIGCDQHPKCKYIAKTIYGDDDDVDAPPTSSSVEEPKLIGIHPGSNEKVLLKNGPYGFYVQVGEDRKGYLPKRASASGIKDVNSITLEDALDLLRYPVTLGNHPDDGQPVILKIAKVGFSIRHRRTMATVPKNIEPSNITLEKALELLSSKDVRRCGRPKKIQS